MGRLAGWLALVMVLVGAFNAVARYLGRYIGLSLSSNAYIELQWYLFSMVFLLGGAYTLLQNGHVRVDVLYSRLSRPARALVDLVGTAILLIPFAVVVLWLSWPSVRNSWVVLERSPDPGGLPRYPIRTMILVGFVLLLAQGISQLLKLTAGWRDGEEPGREAGEQGSEPAGRGPGGAV
jgi:TRAP-type mannitol/chloroaromatic compound transport system permease small subunit